MKLITVVTAIINTIALLSNIIQTLSIVTLQHIALAPAIPLVAAVQTQRLSIAALILRNAKSAVQTPPLGGLALDRQRIL